MTMDITEITFIALGIMVSVVAFFLKKENARVEKISTKLRHIEIELAKNGAKDTERWTQTQKLLEDRRTDIIGIYDKIEKLNQKIDRTG